MQLTLRLSGSCQMGGAGHVHGTPCKPADKPSWVFAWPFSQFSCSLPCRFLFASEDDIDTAASSRKKASLPGDRYNFLSVLYSSSGPGRLIHACVKRQFCVGPQGKNSISPGLQVLITSCCRVVLVDRASQCTSSVFCFVGTGKINLVLALQKKKDALSFHLALIC
jgi:hypothetical protein